MCANYRIHLLLYCVILLSKSCFSPVKSKPNATVTFHEVLSLSISRQWRVWTKTWPCVNPDLRIFVSNVTNSGAPGCVHLKQLTVGWIFGAFHHAPRSLPWGSESNIINIEKLNRYEITQGLTTSYLNVMLFFCREWLLLRPAVTQKHSMKRTVSAVSCVSQVRKHFSYEGN